MDQHDYFNALDQGSHGCPNCGAPIDISETGFAFAHVNGETALFITATLEGATLTALANNPFITDSTGVPHLLGMPVVGHVALSWDDLYASLVAAEASLN